MKAILFDADGVVLKKTAEYFSVKFAREHGAPLAEVTEFFKTTFRRCQEGKLDLKEELGKLLPGWGWKGTTEEYLEYWFTTDAIIDPEVLKIVGEYRSRGVACYLATDQEKYRAEYLRKKLGLESKFDGLFFSSELGYSKEQPEFFEAALKHMGLAAAEILYIDDDAKNVEVAKGLGIDARFYKSIEDIPKPEPQIPMV